MPPLKSDVHWLSFLLRVKTMVSMAVQLKTQNSLTSGRPAELWALRLSEKQKISHLPLSAQSSAPSSPQSSASSWRAGSIGSPSSGSARSSDPLLGSKLALRLRPRDFERKKAVLSGGSSPFYTFSPRSVACSVLASTLGVFSRQSGSLLVRMKSSPNPSGKKTFLGKSTPASPNPVSVSKNSNLPRR